MKITKKETEYLRLNLVLNHDVDSKKVGWRRENSEIFNERLNATYIKSMIFRKGGSIKVPSSFKRSLGGLIKVIEMLNKPKTNELS